MAGVKDQQIMQLEAEVIQNGNAIRSGALYGLLMGMGLGFTFWTHSLDTAHAIFGVALAIFGLIGGMVIGLVISKINTEDETDS